MDKQKNKRTKKFLEKLNKRSTDIKHKSNYVSLKDL